MIHLALWLIAAVIVGYFVLLGLGLVAVVLGNGRWKYFLGGIVIIIAIIMYQLDKQEQAAAARRSQNLPLQQQCISRAEADANRLRQDSLNRNTYTAAYGAQLTSALQRTITNCKIQYPAY